MLTQDILTLITSKCDNHTLENLSRTPVWNIIKTSFTTGFWHLRVQHLMSVELPYKLDHIPVVWKSVYYSLLTVACEKNPLLSISTRNHHAVKILLDLGFDPAEEKCTVLDHAISEDSTETVRLLLSDSRVDPSEVDYDLLFTACGICKLEIVQLLLAAETGDLSEDIGLFSEVIRCGRPDVVSLFLFDGRIAPKDILAQACTSGNVEIVELLLADERVDPTEEDNYALSEAITNGNLEIIKLLLDDSRIDPASDNNEAIAVASCYKNVEVIELLLTYPEVIVTMQCLSRAAYNGNTITMKYLLSRTALQPDKNILLDAARRGNPDIVSLLLTYPSVALTVDIKEAVTMACNYNNYSVFKMLLEWSGIDPSFDDNKLLRNSITDIGREDIITLILQDKRVDVDKIARDVDLEKLVSMILPYIRKQAAGLSMNVRGRVPPSYKSLARLLVLSNPSHSEVVEWMEKREYITGNKDGLSLVYKSFVLLSTLDNNMEKIRAYLLRSEASSRDIELASGLVGARLNTDCYAGQFNFKKFYKLIG